MKKFETPEITGKTERKNISIKPGIREIAEHMASEDRRSFSNLLEFLIMKEAEKRGIIRDT